MNLTNYTCNGTCSNCGQCCTDILNLDKDEIKRIEKYVKEHKLVQHNKGKYNFQCPFRNEFLKKCDIYEVRPYICKLFKCDTPPQKARIQRDEINKGKKVRSMANLFFNDNEKIKGIKEVFGIKVYKKGE